MNASKSAGLVFSALLALLALTSAWELGWRDPGMDAYQFWAVGQALHAPGTAHVYSDADRARIGAEFLERAKRSGKAWFAGVAEHRKVLETYSTPFLYTVFSVLSTGDYETDLGNDRLLLLASLAAGVLALARLANHSWPVALGAVAVFAFWFSPFTSDLRVGNVNAFQLAGIALYVWLVSRTRWRGRDVAGGALLALLMTFKPNLVFVPLVLVLGWIFTRQFRRIADHAAGGILGAIFAVATSAAAFGSLGAWTEWVNALRGLPDAIITVDLGNYAPARLLSDAVGFDPAPLLVVAGTGAVAWALWRRSRAARSGGPQAAPGSREMPEELPLVAIGALLTVLTPRLAWLHYFLLTVPALLVLSRPNESLSSRAAWTRWILLSLAVVGLSVEPILRIGIPMSSAGAGVVIALTTALLFAALLRELAAIRAART